jgi:hypothetical protein
MRLQGLVPSSAASQRHVIAYVWPDADGARFERIELVVDPDEVVDAALSILGEPARADETTDLLVCSHGRRDRCCGSLGTSLAQELMADPRPLGERVRVWRTSHTGGHRFAATAIVLPQGSAWAFCDADLLGQVCESKGPLEGLLWRYRGCSGMSSPAVQVLERAVLNAVGWPLFDMSRRGTELGHDRVELVVDDMVGGRSVWEATVRVAREVLVPDCGSPIELAKKTEPEFVLEDLRVR